jgi:phenylacetate-coenzyme A ligase PaaK-like adenylate-forming protein
MEKIVYLNKEEMNSIQSQRLIEESIYVYENQKPYRKKWMRPGLSHQILNLLMI